MEVPHTYSIPKYQFQSAQIQFRLSSLEALSDRQFRIWRSTIPLAWLWVLPHTPDTL